MKVSQKSLLSRIGSRKVRRCLCSHGICENQQLVRGNSMLNCHDDDNELEFEMHSERNQNKINILCDRFNEILNCDVTLFKQYPTISEHDKRILNCMLLKRSNVVLNLENSYVAQQFWEEDKQQRNDLLKKHHSNHVHWLKEKQELEKCLHSQRTDALCKEHENYVSTITHEIQVKGLRLNKRLKEIEHERDIMQKRRQLIEKQKCDQNARSRQWKHIEDKLQKFEQISELDSRMHRANHTRNHYLDILRKRTIEQNERHQLIHAMNYEEIKESERINLNYLKEKVAECDQRSKQFILNKMQWIEESRNRAHATANLREIIRKSITPDSFSYRN